MRAGLVIIPQVCAKLFSAEAKPMVAREFDGGGLDRPKEMRDGLFRPCIFPVGLMDDKWTRPEPSSLEATGIAYERSILPLLEVAISIAIPWRIGK